MVSDAVCIVRCGTTNNPAGWGWGTRVPPPRRWHPTASSSFENGEGGIPCHSAHARASGDGGWGTWVAPPPRRPLYRSGMGRVVVMGRSPCHCCGRRRRLTWGCWVPLLSCSPSSWVGGGKRRRSCAMGTSDVVGGRLMLSASVWWVT